MKYGRSHCDNTPLICSEQAFVAQWIEHLTSDQRVGGSSPSERTNIFTDIFYAIFCSMRLKNIFLTSVIFLCSQIAVPQPVHAGAEPMFIFDLNLTAAELVTATQIRDSIAKAATEYGITGFTALLYAPTNTGARWVNNELAKISCMSGMPDATLESSGAIADSDFGKCMVFKVQPNSYPNFAKDTEQIAYHEVFHLAEAIRGGSRGRGANLNDMRWLYEGVADIAGYQPQINTNKTTQTELISLLRLYAVMTNSSLTDVSRAWVDNSIAVTSNAAYRTNAMYSRSYLAAYYLTTISTKDKVMNDYFAAASQPHDQVEAFNITFGMTVGEFDAKFRAWISAWTTPTTATTTTTTTTTTTAPQKLKIGGECSPLNAKKLIGGKKATCRMVKKKLVWIRP